MEYSYTPPTKFRAGTTVVWKMTADANYPQSDGFVAKATINGAAKKTITAEHADDVWTFTLKKSENTFPAGQYALYIFFTKGEGENEEVYDLGDPIRLTIETAYSTETQADVRSHSQKMIDDIENALETLATDQGILSVSIAGRAYTRTDIPTLRRMLLSYKRAEHGVVFQEIAVELR